MRPPTLLALLGTVLAGGGGLAACGDGATASSFGGMTQPGVTSLPGAAESTTDTSTTGSADDASNSTASSTLAESANNHANIDETIWDMGMPDFGSGQPAGCAGKIDFLFVISAEGTMQPLQDKLLAAFPGFMAAIEANLPAFDVHILSANTNSDIDLDDCSVCTDSCDPEGEPPFCGAKFTICDKKIGAGVTFPTGPHASNRRCHLDSGLRYIASGQQDSGNAFSCIAQVGTYGGSITAEAMVEALAPAINDSKDEDACNTGFLRDDALLVVTIIQDTYDVYSRGTVDEWIAALRAAKHDDDDAFAVIVLTTDIDVGYDQLCFPDEHLPVKNRLRLLADGVEHGFVGSICLESYGPFFAEHVPYLADLCDDFVPPG